MIDPVEFAFGWMLFSFPGFVYSAVGKINPNYETAGVCPVIFGTARVGGTRFPLLGAVP
jgi:hypothetical protein